MLATYVYITLLPSLYIHTLTLCTMTPFAVLSAHIMPETRKISSCSSARWPLRNKRHGSPRTDGHRLCLHVVSFGRFCCFSGCIVVIVSLLLIICHCTLSYGVEYYLAEVDDACPRQQRVVI